MCIALSSRDRHPPTSRDCVSGWLCSGAAAGGRGTGQGLYCQEINHITRKQKHGWFFRLLDDVTDCNRYSWSSHTQWSSAAFCFWTANQSWVEDVARMLIFSFLICMMPFSQSRRNIYRRIWLKPTDWIWTKYLHPLMDAFIGWSHHISFVSRTILYGNNEVMDKLIIIYKKKYILKLKGHSVIMRVVVSL